MFSPCTSFAPPRWRFDMSASSFAQVSSVSVLGGFAVVPQSSMLRLRRLYQ